MSIPEVQPQSFAAGLRLKQLQMFVTVAETLSFSRAAELLYVSQPLISQQISDLERQVGSPLFIRNRRSVMLTPTGETMLKEANSILQRASNLPQIVKRLGGEDYFDGTLTVGFETMYRREAVTQAAMQFKMQHPNISCSLSRQNFAQTISSLIDGTISVGFILLPQEPLSSDLIIEKLETDQLCIVAAKSLVTFDTLEHYLGLAECLPICLLDKDTRGLNTTLRICCDLSISPQFQFFDSLDDISTNIEAGDGVSFLPYHVFRTRHSPNLACYRLEKFEGAHVDLAACWHKNHGSPLIPLFIEAYQHQLTATGNGEAPKSEG